MRRTVYFLFFIGCFSLAQAQPGGKKTDLPKAGAGTQGEQEEKSAAEFFERNYKPQNYPRYTGPVTVRGDTVFYGKTGFALWNMSAEERLIFTTGLIDPLRVQWFGLVPSGDSLKLAQVKVMAISNLSELKGLGGSVTKKRFRFWLYRPGMANPQVYLFELTNEAAREPMGLTEFIQGARLSFFKEGWIII